MIITDKSILQQISRPTTIDECKQLNIFNKLTEELKNSSVSGAGLAAIQIGIPIRAIYINYVPERGDPYILKVINPVIEVRHDPIVYAGERCLSYPGSFNTDRYNQITVYYTDYDTSREKHVVFYHFLSVLMQHEIDHVNGILLYQREHHTINIGRNDSCPLCAKAGIKIKWKKCKEHNIN